MIRRTALGLHSAIGCGTAAGPGNVRCPPKSLLNFFARIVGSSDTVLPICHGYVAAPKLYNQFAASPGPTTNCITRKWFTEKTIRSSRSVKLNLGLLNLPSAVKLWNWSRSSAQLHLLGIDFENCSIATIVSWPSELLKLMVLPSGRRNDASSCGRPSTFVSRI